MAAIDWDFFIAWLLAPGFGLLVILYFYRRNASRLSRIDSSYLTYLMLGGLWGLGVLFAHPRIRDLPVLTFFQNLAPYLLAASPGLLLVATSNLLRGGRPQWRWWLILPALLILFALPYDGSLCPNLPDTLALGARTFDRYGLWQLILVGANLASVFVTFRLGVEFYRKGWGLVYRNRLRLWLLVFALIALGDLLCLLSPHSGTIFYFGGLIKLSGATLATAILLIPSLPAAEHLLQHFLSQLVMGLVTLGLSVSVIFAAWALLPRDEQSATLVGVAFVSAIIAVIFSPVQRRVRIAVDWLTLWRRSAFSNVRAEYSQQINQELNLEQLAETVISLLAGALHVDSKENDGVLLAARVTNQGALDLRPVTRPRRPLLPGLLCDPDSPLTVFWQESDALLSRLDMQLLPEMDTVSDDELDCLAQWGTELYVPFHSSGQLIGILALGPKRGGDTYSAAEIRFLRSLTSQTVRAFEQARLMSELKTANVQLTHLSDKLAQVNRRLYEADRLKTGFISVITHELRSPFVSLALSFQLIQRHGLEHLTPEQQEQLKTLQKGITELKQMVDHIIAFASLLSKQGELKTETLDLTPIIHETVQAIRPMAESRQITLDARVWPGLPLILGDRARLVEALYHLLHNAIKFNRPGGWVRVRCQPDNGNIDIKVQDSGVGVPAERMEYLWSAFSQVADPLRRGVEGLGLGLALVRYVAVAHGGEVWADSTEGQGSTFGFKVPALKGEGENRLLVTK